MAAITFQTLSVYYLLKLLFGILSLCYFKLHRNMLFISSFIGITKIGIDVNITIDNSGSVETDTGEHRNLVCHWKIPERFTLRGDTKVVTVKAHNDPGNVGAILASFSNGVVTDDSWQCANMDECTLNNSECANWQKAKIYCLGTSCSWDPNMKDQISEAQSAQWIWVENAEATRVWCKKTFGK